MGRRKGSKHEGMAQAQAKGAPAGGLPADRRPVQTASLPSFKQRLLRCTRLTRGAGEASSSLGHGALVDCGLGRARGDAGTGSWPAVIVKQRPAGRAGQGRGRLRRGARARQAVTGGQPGSAPDSPAGLRSVVVQRSAEGGAILGECCSGVGVGCAVRVDRPCHRRGYAVGGNRDEIG